MKLIFDKYREQYQILGYKQFDSLEPINATFLNNGEPIDLSQYYISFQCKKPDGNVVIDDESIVVKNICEIEMLLNEQVTVVNGVVKGEFILIHKVNTRQNATFTFDMEIQQSVIGLNGYSNSLITVAERLHKGIIDGKALHETLTSDINKIKATGNKALIIGGSQFSNNQYTWTHSMDNDNLMVNFMDSNTNEPLMPDYKILDKNNILIRNSTEHPNIKVVLSASYYQGNSTASNMIGTSAPTFTPLFQFQIYINSSTNKVYIAKEKTAPSDWILLN